MIHHPRKHSGEKYGKCKSKYTASKSVSSSGIAEAIVSSASIGTRRQGDFQPV